MSQVKKGQLLTIRQTEGEHLLWERLAEERNMTVSGLVRASVEAYVSGESGVTFSRACMMRVKHRNGFYCLSCGGSRHP